jgi:hypothetical protein
MTSDRPDQISRLYHAALARNRGARRAFLQQACTGDDALRFEVESSFGVRERCRALHRSAIAAYTTAVAKSSPSFRACDRKTRGAESEVMEWVCSSVAILRRVS